MRAIRLVGCRSYRVSAVVAVAFLTFLALGSGPADADVVAGDGFEIHYTPSDTLTAADIEAAKAEVQAAIARLTDFFGHPIPRKLKIEVLKTGRFPQIYRDEYRITYPESRIRSANRFRDPSFVLDITILFEHARDEPYKGKWTVGLATYLQSVFASGKNIYPTFGGDLHAETAKAIDRAEWVVPMAETTAVRNARRKTLLVRRLAMLQQGSFVRHLINQKDGKDEEALEEGKARFLRLYRGEDFAAVYGIPQCEAERNWFARIVKLDPSLARPAMSQFAPTCPAGR